MSCCFQIDRVDEGRAESAETEVGREVKPRARSVGGGGDVCGAKTLTCVGFFFKNSFWWFMSFVSCKNKFEGCV